MLTIEAASDLAAATTAAEEAADGAAARLVVQVCDLEPAWRKRVGRECNYIAQYRALSPLFHCYPM